MVQTITMRPVTLDLAIYAGDGFTVQFVFADQATGLPWDAVGVWEAQVRATAASPAPVASFTIDTSDHALGIIRASLTGDQCRAVLAYKHAVWDLQQTPAGQEPRTWYSGRIAAAQDVTRP